MRFSIIMVSQKKDRESSKESMAVAVLKRKNLIEAEILFSGLLVNNEAGCIDVWRKGFPVNDGLA